MRRLAAVILLPDLFNAISARIQDDINKTSDNEVALLLQGDV